jgi:hypothetical protein
MAFQNLSDLFTIQKNCFIDLKICHTNLRNQVNQISEILCSQEIVLINFRPSEKGPKLEKIFHLKFDATE